MSAHEVTVDLVHGLWLVKCSCDWKGEEPRETWMHAALDWWLHKIEALEDRVSELEREVPDHSHHLDGDDTTYGVNRW